MTFPKTDAPDALSDRHTWRSKRVQHTSCLVAREEEGTMIVLVSEGTGVLGAMGVWGRGARGEGAGLFVFLLQKDRLVPPKLHVKKCKFGEVWSRKQRWRKDGGHSPHRDQTMNVPA